MSNLCRYSQSQNTDFDLIFQFKMTAKIISEVHMHCNSFDVMSWMSQQYLTQSSVLIFTVLHTSDEISQLIYLTYVFLRNLLMSVIVMHF